MSIWNLPLRTRFTKERLAVLFVWLIPACASAQGAGYERPWGRLPYSPLPHYEVEQPTRYNPWAQMRDARRLAPPDYHGEAEENAPKYEKPDPAYRELPKQREVLSDPRAYGSPWSKLNADPVFGYAPYYPGGSGPISPWQSPFYGLHGSPRVFSPWFWQLPGW